MKISYNWLKEYIDIQISPEELVDRMTFAGIEVEAVEKKGEDLQNIVLAKILKKDSHPDADKLSVCKVFDGVNEYQVVCGAPNCTENKVAALAKVGTQLGDIKLKKAKIRGVQSFGMLCSEKELGLSDDHDGIIMLPEDTPLGQSIADVYNISDTVYDVEITPNRPDLLGMLCVARDLSALTGLPLKEPVPVLTESSIPASEKVKVVNNAPEKCTRYTARYIEGVKIQESPTWLKERLEAVGLRPVNNVVDVTNFVMMELGHPLHAFDYDKLDQHTIVVRTAADGEKITALDNNEYTLTEDDLVIADAVKPSAIAGVIGGAGSQITEETVNIVIESANFSYNTVRRTGNRYKISTDSSYRFERDMSDINAELAGKRAAELILQVAGGTLYAGFVDSYPNPQETVNIKLRYSRIEHVLGLKIPDEDIKNYIKALGCKITEENGDDLIVESPHFRKDLAREIDYIEEIIRLHGYNNVPVKKDYNPVMNHTKFYLKRELQDQMVQCGFFEAINWPYSSPDYLNQLKIAEDDIRRNNVTIKNPLGAQYSIMQSMILPNLLKNAVTNINNGNKNVRLFEMTKVFSRSNDNTPAHEILEMCGVMLGESSEMYWKSETQPVDFFDMKGVVEDILRKTAEAEFSYAVSVEPFLQKGQAADVYYKKQKIGYLGKLDTKIAESFDIDEPVYCMNLDVEILLSIREQNKAEFTAIPHFPSISRDISFVVAKSVTVKEIIDAVKKVNPKLIKSVSVFDDYQGKGIEDGFRSLSFKIIFLSETKTLTDGYVSKLFDKILSVLRNKFEIIMR